MFRKLLLLALFPASLFAKDLVDPFDNVGRDAMLVTLARPEYPDLAFERRIEGTAIVAVHVDESGKPLLARIIRSSSVLFEEAALRSAMNSRFSPAVGDGGKPVASLVQMPFAFRIR